VFGELADQCLDLVTEEATANGTNRKWLDKQRATLALIREIVGADTPVAAIDYDACLRVRSTLACVPVNRTKLYKGLPLDKAISRAAAAGKPVLSAATQQAYLGAFKDVLDLAARKRLIPVNPAEGLRPLKRDAVAPADKREPFTLEQLNQFFQGEFYEKCAASGPVPYRFDKRGVAVLAASHLPFRGAATQRSLPDAHRRRSPHKAGNLVLRRRRLGRRGRRPPTQNA
jgi:hypothetical protein